MFEISPLEIKIYLVGIMLTCIAVLIWMVVMVFQFIPYFVADMKKVATGFKELKRGIKDMVNETRVNKNAK